LQPPKWLYPKLNWHLLRYSLSCDSSHSLNGASTQADLTYF